MNFLEESYEISETSEKGLFEMLTRVSNRTHFEVVDPVSITIYSLLREPAKGATGFDIVKIKPAYADMRLFTPQRNNSDAYFAADKGNIGTMPFDAFVNSGLPEEMLEEIKTIGYFMQVTTEKGMTVTLIPSKGFLATWCRQCGVGKLEEGIDPMRDIYLASRLVYAEPFTLVYRTDGKFGKAFGCFSSKFGADPQMIIWDFKERLMREYSNVTVRYWEYTHSITSVDFTLNDKTFKAGNMRVTPGVRFTLSDVGDASYTFRLVLYCNGGCILLPATVSRKRCGKLDIADMVKEFYESCIPEIDRVQKMLEKASAIKVKNTGDKIVNILRSVGFSTAIGKKDSEEYYNRYLQDSVDGTMEDVLVAILRIPGIAKQKECRSCLNKISDSIGNVFSAKEVTKLYKEG